SSIVNLTTIPCAMDTGYDNGLRTLDRGCMGLPRQTVALHEAARQLHRGLPADAVLLLTETNLDWDEVLQYLGDCKLLVAAQDGILTQRLKENPGLTVLDIDPGPTPTQERMSLALPEAVAAEKLQTGAEVVALYNGSDAGRNE